MGGCRLSAEGPNLKLDTAVRVGLGLPGSEFRCGPAVEGGGCPSEPEFGLGLGRWLQVQVVPSPETPGPSGRTLRTARAGGPGRGGPDGAVRGRLRDRGRSRVSHRCRRVAENPSHARHGPSRRVALAGTVRHHVTPSPVTRARGWAVRQSPPCQSRRHGPQGLRLHWPGPATLCQWAIRVHQSHVTPSQNAIQRAVTCLSDSLVAVTVR